jgi:hypothetical protein
VTGALAPASLLTAGGGSSNANCSEAILEPSWPLMSVDDAGVGSNVARGMMVNMATGRTGYGGVEE